MLWARSDWNSGFHGNGQLPQGYNGENLKKIFFSETIRPRALIFYVYQCLVTPFINPANRVPGAQIGHAPGASLSNIGLEWEKYEKIFFSETTRPKTYIFSMQQRLVVPFINPANHAPWVQVGHAPGVIGLHRLIIGKNVKKSSSLKP